MDCVHHIWCPLFSQEFQDLPDGAETTLTTLSRSTDINVHLPTYVGTDDGISGSIMLVPTGREYDGINRYQSQSSQANG
ncbi:hypothetical protein CSO28_24510 [Salmonella enterica subsp. enterica serovar Infantis]|nr:hypothetical protein [Salmonella enterica subsp. enterica serovar Infantis]EEV5815627.1 hypothetical protein [Escherichia coli]EFX6127010.1 hypothetical protein [Shigella boydii]EFB1315234.1 hypothetical protein [Escherichia coli]MFB49997.1 hypothetical protein [Escherichia coli]